MHYKRGDFSRCFDNEGDKENIGNLDYYSSSLLFYFFYHLNILGRPYFDLLLFHHLGRQTLQT